MFRSPRLALLATVLLPSLLAVAPAPAAVVTETVVYEHDGVVLEGYLAYDDAVTARVPGVLVVHQWMGVTDNERLRAEMLASQGYVAFACDVYGQGVRPQDTEEASEQAGKYYGDRELFRARLRAGLAQLLDQPLVDPARTAAIGYCFGGSAVLELARDGADLAGVVSFHGSLETPRPAPVGGVNARVLVCHGAVDPYVPMEDVAGFVEEMEQAGVDYQLIMYADAVHAFTQKEAGDDPATGAAYHAVADRRSWAHMQGFFAEIFD